MGSATPPLVLAHAVSVRSDLPVPLLAVLLAGAFAVVVTFVALGAFWHTPKLRGDRAGLVLPDRLQRLLDSRVTRWGGGLPQYAVGHPARVRRIRAALAGLPGLAVAGAAYDGVGVPACARSGREAGQAALAGVAHNGAHDRS